MFDVGFSELVLLFVIGLLILGPERLPRVAAQLGRWVARARRTATQLRMQFEREMTMQDIMMKQQRKAPKDDAKSKAVPAKEPAKEPAAAAAPDPEDTRHRPSPDESDMSGTRLDDPIDKPAEHADESR